MAFVSDARAIVRGWNEDGPSNLWSNPNNWSPVGVPQPDDDLQFVLITNDHTEAVAGTSAGLPQGANVQAGSQVFQISYTGGDGNDVVLTKTGDLPPPMLYLEKISPTQVRRY